MVWHAHRLARVMACGLIGALALNTAQADDSGNAPTATAKPASNISLDALQAQVDQLQGQITQLQDNAANQKQDGLPLHGFMDVGFAQSSGLDANKLPSAARQYLQTKGFYAGSVDLYLTPSFGRVKSLTELVLEYEPDLSGTVGIDMERLQIGYAVSDNNTAWLGRFHTPYGYWNTAYHHGAELQPSVNRPQFLQFEDHYGVLPAHTVGVWWAGHSKTGAGKFLYDLYAGNGDSINVDDNRQKILNFNPFTDDNNNKEVGARLALETSFGLQVGLHGFSEDVNVWANNSSTLLAQSTVRMFGGYAHLDSDTWDLLAELYHFDNTTDQNVSGVASTGGSHSSTLWFAQAGYTLGVSWFPYLRYEHSQLDGSDIYFSAQTGGFSYDKSLIGVRYNLDTRSAFKVELAHYDIKAGTTLNTSGNAPAPEAYAGTGYNEVRVQLSTSF